MDKWIKLQKLFGAKGSKASLVHYGLVRGERGFTLRDAADDSRLSKEALLKAIKDLVELGIFKEEMTGNRNNYFMVKSKEIYALIGK